MHATEPHPYHATIKQHIPRKKSRINNAITYLPLAPHAISIFPIAPPWNMIYVCLCPPFKALGAGCEDKVVRRIL